MRESKRTKFPHHRALLLPGFGLWSDALVLLAPRPGLDRPLAIVRRNRRAIANPRHANPWIGWIGARHRPAWRVGAPHEQQNEPRQRRGRDRSAHAPASTATVRRWEAV